MKEDKLVVEYDKTKNHYVILNKEVLMKDPTTREWKKSVIYQQYKELNSKGEYVLVLEENRLTFVREFKDFWNKFTLCLDL